MITAEHGNNNKGLGFKVRKDDNNIKQSKQSMGTTTAECTETQAKTRAIIKIQDSSMPFEDLLLLLLLRARERESARARDSLSLLSLSFSPLSLFLYGVYLDEHCSHYYKRAHTINRPPNMRAHTPLVDCHHQH
jgi:hypothetical protein